MVNQIISIDQPNYHKILHLHAHLCAPPCTSVHESNWLSVPTTVNQIINIDQPNNHKILHLCAHLHAPPCMNLIG